MKSTVLNPDKKNLIDTFVSDELGRGENVFDFVSLLNAIEGAYSIALDAQWGAGKTFFVKQVQLVLEALNWHTATSLTEEEKDSVIFRWEKICSNHHLPDDHAFQDYVPVYYDAWMNDSDEDPLFSLIYSITLQIKNTPSIIEKPDLWKSLNAVVDGVATLVSNSKFGPLAGAANTFKNGLLINNPLDAYEKKAHLREKIDEFFGSLLKERAPRLVVFIDELDRCKPTFAVQLLERIKHYFNHENITFVFSVNISELCHTVKTLYGEGFDAERYLDRFFDLRVELPSVENAYCRWFSRKHVGTGSKICNSMVDIYRMPMRIIGKYFERVKAASSYFTDQGNDFKYFCNRVILPVAIGLYLLDRNAYDAFITGKDVNPLLRAAEKAGVDVETEISSYNCTEEEKQLSTEEKLMRICAAVFTTERDVKVCGFWIDSYIQDGMRKAITSVTPYRGI